MAAFAAPAFAGGKTASAAGSLDASDSSSWIAHTFYEWGDGTYAEEYEVNVGTDTAAQLGYAGYSPYGLLSEIEYFATAYENFMFNPDHSNGVFVQTDASSSDTYLDLYVEFPSYDAYCQYYGEPAPTGDRAPDRTTLFTKQYINKASSWFGTPWALSSVKNVDLSAICNNNAGNFTLQDAANNPNSLFSMLPFLFYGSGAYGGVNFSFNGLTSYMSAYFVGRTLTLASLFANFAFYDQYAIPTVYFRTNADSRTKLSGMYFHVWNMSYASTSPSLDPNRKMVETYIVPRTAVLYALSIAAAVILAGILIVFMVILPRKKGTYKKTDN